MQIRFQVWRSFVAVAALSTVAAAACSGDGGSSTAGDNGGSNGSGSGGDSDGGASGSGNAGTGGLPIVSDGGSIYKALGVEDPMPDEFHFSDVEAPYDDVAGCKAFDSAFPDVHSCSCDNCYDVQRQCDALQSCREIAECGIDIGCTDAYSCYLAASDPQCVPIIDKWGNTGVAVALSLQLGTCTVDAGCR